MNQDQRIKICQQCVFKKEDVNRGLLCSLTGRQPNFIGNCASYKENTLIVKGNDSFFDFGKEKTTIKKNQASKQHVKTVKTSTSYKKYKSSSTNGKIAWKLVVFLFILFKVGYRFYRNAELKKTKQIRQTTLNYLNSEDKRKRKKTNQSKTHISSSLRRSAIKLMVPKHRLDDKRFYLENDTTFTIANKIKITLNKQYYISFKQNDELPLYATARKYTFTYNKVKKDKHKTIKEQWLEYRKQLNPNIVIKLDYIDTKSKIPVEKIQFYFNGRYKTYGAAKLIEIGNTRYFFQFTYMSTIDKYNQLGRYLNYYVQLAKK